MANFNPNVNYGEYATIGKQQIRFNMANKQMYA